MARILVVDDNLVIQRVLSVTLQRDGHTIITAQNGREGLARLAEEEVDLVVTDLSMPEMDGLEMLLEIRADDRFKHVPVIMLTASAQERDDTTARARGVSAFLLKPVSSWELTSTVGRLLED